MIWLSLLSCRLPLSYLLFPIHSSPRFFILNDSTQPIPPFATHTSYFFSLEHVHPSHEHLSHEHPSHELAIAAAGEVKDGVEAEVEVGALLVSFPLMVLPVSWVVC